MPRVLKGVEQFVVLTLIVLMVIVVLLSTLELGWIILQDISSPPIGLLEIDELLEVFGFFLLVLIGVELLDTIRAYLAEHTIHAEVVLEVALIAIARKVIILDVKELSSLTLIGIAAILIALAVAYYVIKRLISAAPK